MSIDTKKEIIELISKLEDTDELQEIIRECNSRILEINFYWGKLLKDYRIWRGNSIREMAEKLKISIGFLSDIENGKRGMSEETFSKVYEILKK